MEFNFTGGSYSKDAHKIAAMLKVHFNPAPFEIVECYKFNSLLWQAVESVSNFSAELHSLARHCNYGASLHDRIVYGIR